jgi:ADP-ribose pyrophosphatase YjhB (NUDIX family)
MSFLRLGVACAVMDDEERVLLSRRGDLDIWNLPGGRLDSGERLDEAAAREVREETGVIPHVERPVGLYYWASWERLNVLYAGWPLGGEPLANTGESRDNRYFDTRHLPDNLLWGEWMVFDALSETRPMPRVLETPAHELRAVKRRLAWRWVKNLLRGRPEPRYPRFRVHAVGVVWDEDFQRVLTFSGADNGYSLPRVVCTGGLPPWEELAGRVYQQCWLKPTFQWVGLWHDVENDTFEFIFAATVPEIMPSGITKVNLRGGAEEENSWWLPGVNVPLIGRDAEYLLRVRPTYMADAVWTIMPNNHMADGEVVIRGKKHESG